MVEKLIWKLVKFTVATVMDAGNTWLLADLSMIDKLILRVNLFTVALAAFELELLQLA